MRQRSLFSVGGPCVSAYVIKLNALGTRALYSTYLGGHNRQEGEDIAVNSSGNAIVVGYTLAADFPTTAGTAQPVFAGVSDAFVAQVSSSGSHLNFSTLLGGTGGDEARGVALDSTGNVFVTGHTASTNFPLKNAFLKSCSGGCVFVTKLSPTLRLLYSTFLGNGGGTGVAVTPGGQAFITGNTDASFPTTLNAFQRVLLPITFPPGTANSGVFISKLSPTGLLSYSSLYGGNVSSSRVALDRSANAYITGTVGYPGFSVVPITPGAFLPERGAELDSFVAKVVSACVPNAVTGTVAICSPASGSTVTSPVRIVAGTPKVTPVKLTQIYLDGKKIYEARLSAISVSLPIAAGTHRRTVQAIDTSNAIVKKSITVTVH